MKIVVDIDENIYTKLFDNGVEDYEIINDDIYSLAKAIRKGAILQEPKTGHWILRKSFADMDDCECDICNQMTTTLRGNRMNYCPNCGCRMVEPQKSEVSE